MTPRRVLLLVGGLVAFAATYLAYARLFGWMDGLPLLPSRMLAANDGSFRPEPRLTSPTIDLLRAAFGEHSPETEAINYPTQLRFIQGDSSVVIASGSPPANPNSTEVTLSPFSIAVFGKPKAQHLLQPGEVVEISTIHSDKAVLEFDRKITSATEMSGAKLVRLRLVSDPEQTIPDPMKRRGRVHITNNQRSADPTRHLTVRTVGPVFYRDPNAQPGKKPATGPDIWTDAPVEIVDRSNLPARPGTATEDQRRNPTAPAAAGEVRTPSAVSEVLSGLRLPPPTITAVGLRVYLEQDDEPAPPKKGPQPKGAPKSAPPKKPRDPNQPAPSGVRRVEFVERVVMNLWVEGGQGLVGANGRSAVVSDATPADVAVGGGLVPAALAARRSARDLLQVETRGPFAYDAEKNTARFDVLPIADPNLPNDVQVTKVPPRAAAQTLFSQVLELEFNGSPTGDPAKTPGVVVAAKPVPGNPAPPVAPKGAKFKRLHAWTYTPGRFLTISSEPDKLEAYGQDLVYEEEGGRVRLTGAPLYAVSERNVLTAGGPRQAAVLTIERAPGTTEKDRKSQASVQGFGKVELFDKATNASTVTASWLTSMTQTREKVNDRELELYTFTDGAKFEDVKADYWLKGNTLRLWVARQSAEPGEPAPAAGASPKMSLHRLQGIGAVSAHTADMDVEQAEHLNSLFRDETLAAAPKPPAAPRSEGPAAPKADSPAAPKQPGPAAPAPKEPEKPKNPMKLRARTIETWVVRQSPPPGAAPPPAAVAAAPGGLKPERGVKYQLEKARCEGTVSVHQDPADPTKPRGTDVLGSTVLIDGAEDGNILTVYGWDDRPGEVHNEGTSLIGPKIVLDQLHNLASVEGRGSLVMASATDFGGAALRQPEPVVIHFRDGMLFQGAKKVADFFGKVTATQGPSWVACHTLQVNFDRPVYFTQANRPGEPKRPPDPKAPNAPDDDKPKLDVLYCYPAPADTADTPLEKQVYFNQVDRDPVTGKPIRVQKVTAREIMVRGQARDPSGGEPYRLVVADGPGSVRTWQPASKEAGPGLPGEKAPEKPAPGAAPAEQETRLTLVTFSGRMTAKDKGDAYKEATFLDQIEVISVPTDNPELKVERHKLPAKAVLLTCSKQLVLWSHKKPDEPAAAQHMHATGNAFLQSDEYDAWGDTISSEGKTVIIEALGAIPARIKSRFKGNDQTGKRIVFDRATNHYTVTGSIGGTITSSESGPPKQPPKK